MSSNDSIQFEGCFGLVNAILVNTRLSLYTTLKDYTLLDSVKSKFKEFEGYLHYSNSCWSFCSRLACITHQAPFHMGKDT